MKSEAYDAAGILGSILGLSVPKMDFVKDWISICAGIVGIIFVVVSIRHKIYEIKKMKRDDQSKTAGKEN